MSWFWRRRVHAADAEIHVPISPTEHFFTMLRYLAASLRLNAGALAGSRIIATVGADEEPVDLYCRLPWSRRYGIEWRWLDRGLYQRSIYYATAVERFRYSFQAPVVLLLDADVLITAPLDHLVARVLAERALHGLVAHVSPFVGFPQQNGEQWWERLFGQAGLGAAPLCCEHTAPWFGTSDEKARRCPPYFNLGVLAAPAEVMNTVGQTIYEEMELVNACLATDFRCQIGLTLALRRHHIPWRCLRLRYNCPNCPAIVERYGSEAEKMRIFHYLGQNAFKKHIDFANEESVVAFLRRTDLEPINRCLQQQLRRIHRHIQRDAA
jgi:hypothetical protein